MRRPIALVVLSLASSILAAPYPAAAQDGVRYAFAGGLNLTSSPSVVGQHLSGSALFEETPIPGVGVRVDATLLSDTNRGTGTLNLAANLRVPLLERRTVSGYAAGGGGYAVGSWRGPVLNAAIGAEKLTNGRPIFLEFGVRLWGGHGPSSGIMTFSFGTLF